MMNDSKNPLGDLFPIFSDSEMRARLKMMFNRKAPGRPKKADPYIGSYTFIKWLTDRNIMTERQFKRFLSGRDPFIRKNPKFTDRERMRISKMIYDVQTGRKYRDGVKIIKSSVETKPLPVIMAIDVLSANPVIKPFEPARSYATLPKMGAVFGVRNDNQRVQMLGARGLRVGNTRLSLGMQGNKR